MKNMIPVQEASVASKTKYDVCYPSNGIPQAVPHFCREFDMDENGDFVGCYGMNMTHGYTFEEAKAEIVAWLERELEAAKQMQEEEHQAHEDRQWWEDNI